MIKFVVLCCLVAAVAAGPPLTKTREEIEGYKSSLEKTRENLEQQRHILYTIDVVQRHTCVRFRVRNNNDRNFVRLTGRPTGCYASVGFYQNRGVHTMNLARNRPGHGCFNTIVVIHEWMHILGFFHMQSTYNRYDYVRIHWENIQPGVAFAFYRHGTNIVSNLGLPYEYGSCMHYSTHAFSHNGRPTISTTRNYNGVLGQIVNVTGWDFWRITRHHNCPGAWSAEASLKARTTSYEMIEDGTLVETAANNLLADEFEPIDQLED